MDIEPVSNLITEGKNAKLIICKVCNCKILKSNIGTFHTLNPDNGFLPNERQQTGGNEVPLGETLKYFWELDDVFQFENIGFSRDSKEKKYLTCADCERGILGFQDLITKKIYLAHKRVAYQ